MTARTVNRKTPCPANDGHRPPFPAPGKLDAATAGRYNPPAMQPDEPASQAVAELYRRQSPCRLCPRNCNASRQGADLGYCRSPRTLVVADSGPHFGEERALVGTGGSGTIFLSGCNLLCAFCQNARISHHQDGVRWDIGDLIYAMLRLADGGCENINFVTPTHYSPQVAEAIVRARGRGLDVPIVYNCGGYESAETLRLLNGLVEIYMPDFKFWNPDSARRYADAPDYPDRAREALREMHRQVGDLAVAGEVACRGLLVRHLVMPDGTAEGRAILDFLAHELSPRTYVNVMAQYHPLHRAGDFPEIDRPPTEGEVLALKAHAQQLGLRLAE